MKKVKTSSKNENLADILKQFTKRVEEATADIHGISGDVAGMRLSLNVLKIDVSVIKSDVEKLRDEVGEIKDELKETENRLNTRITHVGDLITVELGKKIQAHAKRITHLERINVIS